MLFRGWGGGWGGERGAAHNEMPVIALVSYFYHVNPLTVAWLKYQLKNPLCTCCFFVTGNAMFRLQLVGYMKQPFKKKR